MFHGRKQHTRGEYMMKFPFPDELFL